MPKNQQLKDALDNNSLGQQRNWKKALDALLAVDYNAPNAFVAPMKANQDVWSKLNVTEFEDAAFVFDSNLAPIPKDLFKLAAQKRVELSLAELSDVELKAIANALNNNAIRTELNKPKLGLQSVHGGFNPVNENVISNLVAIEIKKKARAIILLKEVMACNALADIANIESLINNRGGLVFKGINDAKLDDLDDNAKKQVLEHWLSLKIKFDRAHLLANINAVETELRKPDNNFSSGFLVNVDKFKDNVNAKGLLGRSYLKEKLTNSKDSDRLFAIAAAKDSDSLQDALAKFTGGANDKDQFIKYAVNDKTGKENEEIRRIALREALLNKLLTCADQQALQQLIQAKDTNEMRKVFEKADSLGLAGRENAAARKLLTDDLLKEALGLACYRSVIVADISNLAAILDDSVDDSHIASLKGVKVTTPTLIKQGLTEFKKNAPLLVEAKQDALIALLKRKAKDPGVVSKNFNKIAEANTQARLQNKVGALIGSNKADPLIGAQVDQGFAKRLRSAAKVEEWVLTAKANPSDPALVAVINTFQPAPLFPDATPLITDAEKSELGQRLMEIYIENCSVAQKDQLSALAQAKNLDEFRAQLNAVLGAAPNRAWVNEAVRKQLQAKASQKSFEFALGSSPVGEPKHLKAFLSELPPTTQQALLAEPAVLNTLKQAQNINDIRLTVGTLTPSAKALIEENKQLGHLNRIVNAGIAKVLASIDPPVVLDDKKVKAINELIEKATSTNFSIAGFPNFLQNLASAAGIDTSSSTFTNFNIAFTANPNTRTAIENQYNHNLHLYTTLGTTPSTDKETRAVIRFLMRLEKTGAFPTANIAIIKNALFNPTPPAEPLKNRAELEKTLKTAGLLPGGIFPVGHSIEKYVTQELYNDLVAAEKNQKLNDNTQYETVLNAQKETISEMKDELDKLEKTDRWVRDDLIELRDKKVFVFKDSEGKERNWSNSVYGATARQGAKLLLPTYRRIASECDVVVPRLLMMQETYRQMLAELPIVEKPSTINKAMSKLPLVDDPETKRKNAVFNRRKMLEAELAEVEGALRLYGGVAEKLNGTSTATGVVPGLIQQLEEAAGVEGDIQINISYKYEDFSPENKEEILKNKGVVIDSNFTKKGTTATSGGAKYESGKPIESGYCRAYVIESQDQIKNKPNAKDNNLFIEEYSPNGESKLVGGQEIVIPTVKMTSVKFPSDETDRLNYCMALAAKLIERQANPPTAQNPIVLDGSNPEELLYLWTALVKTGQQQKSGMKFGPDAIKVASPVFNPDKHIGWFGRLKDIPEVFEKVDIGLKAKQLSADKSNIKKAQLEELKKSEEIKSQLRTGKTLFDKIDTANKEENASKPRLGTTRG